jgi:hypothetical protein
MEEEDSGEEEERVGESRMGKGRELHTYGELHG